jgi:thiol-disulfide isomerase/thioredoxin
MLWKLAEQYEQVIVMDFWATWCSPCLDDFQIMRAFKDKIATDSISYVYICSQSSAETWKMQIAKYQVKGQHYFISDLQFDELRKQYDLKALPSYLIIDSQSRLQQGYFFKRNA